MILYLDRSCSIVAIFVLAHFQRLFQSLQFNFSKPRPTHAFLNLAILRNFFFSQISLNRDKKTGKEENN